MTRWILGEFRTAESMVAALRRLRASGFADLDSHSPFPVEGVDEALALPTSWVPYYTLLGGLLGMLTGYVMQWWCNGVDYPINVGNRPPLHWNQFWLPTTIPVTFELAVLFASFGAFFGQFWANRLPQPYHPVFESEAFRGATLDRFYVSVATGDAEHEEEEIERILNAEACERISVVVTSDGTTREK